MARDISGGGGRKGVNLDEDGHLHTKVYSYFVRSEAVLCGDCMHCALHSSQVVTGVYLQIARVEAIALPIKWH